MKKNLFVLLVLTVLFCISCQNDVEVGNEEKEFNKTFLSILDLQTRTIQKGINVISKYVDLTNIQSRHTGNDFEALEEIGLLLNSLDFSQKRTINHTTQNLENDLNEIINEFSENLENLLPDPTPALSLSFVEETENGLKIGDDMEIPYKSIEGALSVELLNAFANGENLENLFEDMENNISKIYEKSNSKGVVVVEDGRWIKGVVNYRWGKISDEHKEAVKIAMNTWETVTEGKVSFNELEDTLWNNFQIGIHAIGVVNIYDEEMEGTNGLAHIGYGGGERFFKLRTDMTDVNELKRTPLHELGHTLGLYHEHQRYNRDEFLVISNDDHNFDLIPKEISDCRWVWKRIKIGWWTISIPYLTWSSTTNSYTSGEFDFNSIMLYSGLSVQKDKQYLNNNKAKTVYNTELSLHDIELIKSIY